MKYSVGDHLEVCFPYKDPLNGLVGVVDEIDSEPIYEWDDEEEDEVETGNYEYVYGLDFTELNPSLNKLIYGLYYIDEMYLTKVAKPIVVEEPDDSDLI